MEIAPPRVNGNGKHRKPRAPKADPSRVMAENSHLPFNEIMRIINDNSKSFQELKTEYKDGFSEAMSSMLDASDPSNRFMRYRIGLGGGGDAHLYWQRMWWVRETSRHMVDNDDFIGQAHMRLTDNIVQDGGFRLTMQTGDKGLDTDIEERFAEWGGNPKLCDYFGERDWSQLQWIAQYQCQVDGEIFCLPVNNGTLQLLETERCLTYRGQNELNFLGREFTKDGRIVAYQFTEEPLGPYRIQYVGPTIRIPKYDSDGLVNVFHIYDSRRVTRHIGVPWITAAMIKCGMLDDIEFAMLTRAQSCAAHAAFLKQTTQLSGAAPKLGQRGTPITTPAPDGSLQLAQSDALKYGQYIVLPYGYEVSEFSPSIPNAEFFPHVRETKRQISCNLSMPVEMSLLDASQTNFSGWRGAMDQARMSFRRWQSLLAGQLHRPTLCFNVRRWAAEMGKTAMKKLADGSLYKHKWTPPAWPYINPKEDAEAGKVLIETGQMSPRGLAASRGENYDEIVCETVEDRSAALRLAIAESDKIEAETGRVVDPIILLGLNVQNNLATVPKAAQVAPKPKPGAPPAGEDEPAEGDDGQAAPTPDETAEQIP